MAGETRLDAVGVALPQLLRPGAVTGVELAGRVALRTRGQLLELEPEDPAPVGSPRRVDRDRLATGDRPLGGQQASIGLVDRPRDAVETRCDVDDCRPPQPLVSLPARQLGERVVDLHLGAPVAEAARGLAGELGKLGPGEEPPVQLGRSDVRNHRLATRA